MSYMEQNKLLLRLHEKKIIDKLHPIEKKELKEIKETKVVNKQPKESNINEMVNRFISIQLNKSVAMKTAFFRNKESYLEKEQKQFDRLKKELKKYNKWHMLKDILNFIVKDRFWSKNILTFTKLMSNNKEWMRYRAVIVDKLERF